MSTNLLTILLTVASTFLYFPDVYQEPRLAYDWQGEIDEKLVETSGLIYWNNLLWAHNDDGQAIIYGITKAGKIKKTIRLKGITNNDWEDIAQDNTYIYIGDIGTSKMENSKFTIYRLPKALINSEKYQEIKSEDVEKIKYTFPNREKILNGKNKYDCEAMVVVNSTLHLFTKGWNKSKISEHYIIKLPVTKKETTLTLLDSIQKGNLLITGADINSKGKLVLIGLEEWESSSERKEAKVKLMLLNANNERFIDSSAQTYFLNMQDSLRQVEAVCFKNDTELFFADDNRGGRSNLYKSVIISQK